MSHIVERLAGNSKAIPCLFYPVAKKMQMHIEEILTQPEKQAELLVYISEHYPVGAVVRMTELWCEVAAFGMECTITDDDFPKLGMPLFEDVEDLENLQLPQVINAVTGPLIEAVSLASPKITKPLIIGITGPYTLGAVMNGSEDFMMNCMMEPEICQDFLEKITDFLMEYAAEYKKAGATAVMIAEPSTGMISPQMLEDFSNVYIQKIIDELQDDEFSILYHNCGNVNPHLDSIMKLTARGFHFGSTVTMADAISKVRDDTLIMGNVEPQLFLGDNADAIEKAVKELEEFVKTVPNYHLSTGCDLSPVANLDSIDTFLKNTIL